MSIRSEQAAPTYVVIGASGILAPLGGLLRAQGAAAFRVGVSRGSRLAAGEWDRRVALDARDDAAVRGLADALAADGRQVHTVIAYAPALSLASWVVLTDAALRAVIVLPSRFANPAGGEEISTPWMPTASTRRVLLGWTDDGDAVRWHTPEEVSRVVADAVRTDSGETLTVGRLRPWHERPD